MVSNPSANLVTDLDRSQVLWPPSRPSAMYAIETLPLGGFDNERAGWVGQSTN